MSSANVFYWHETDMPTAMRDVRSRGQSGKHILAVSLSGFDPKATSPLRHAGHQHPIADTFASGTKRGIGA
jgi:hypothetical protein